MNLASLFLTIILFCFNSESKKIFNAKSIELKNGLRLVVVENPRAPVIAQMIWYDFGSSVEQKGKSGLAHFMEHLMFKGTKKYPQNYYSDFLSKIGGSENAFTSYDYTAYFQIFPSQKLEKIIELEADRMKNLTLTRENVDIERKVILEERFQRIESDPSAQLDESMRSALYPNDYYGRPIIGWKHEIENLSYEDVINFYENLYSPENATVILSGDVKFSEAKKIIKKYYGKIEGKEKNYYPQLSNPDFKTKTLIELKNQNVKQQIWKRIYRTKTYNDSIIESLALDIGMKILAGGSSSILYEKLVRNKELFSMVGGFYQGFAKGEGYIYFYAIPNKNMDDDQISNLLDQQIINSIKENITQEKLDLEKKKYYYDSIYGMDGILKPAEIIGEALSVGLEINEIESWNDTLEKITLKMVKKELKKFQINKNFITGSLKN